MQQRNMALGGKGQDPDEPPGARGEMGFILDKWVTQVQANNDRGAVQFILQLLQRGFLKGDDVSCYTHVVLLRCSARMHLHPCTFIFSDLDVPASCVPAVA